MRNRRAGPDGRRVLLVRQAPNPVDLHHLCSSDELPSYFMGRNTPERQDFIIDNLRVEKDLVEA